MTQHQENATSFVRPLQTAGIHGSDNKALVGGSEVIATIHGVDDIICQQRADYISNAVNSHAVLIEALEGLLKEFPPGRFPLKKDRANFSALNQLAYAKKIVDNAKGDREEVTHG